MFVLSFKKNNKIFDRTKHFLNIYLKNIHDKVLHDKYLVCKELDLIFSKWLKIKR